MTPNSLSLKNLENTGLLAPRGAFFVVATLDEEQKFCYNKYTNLIIVS